MKNKLDWFNDNRNLDARLTRMLYELLLSPTYRWPWKVKAVCSYRRGLSFQSVRGAESPWSMSTNSSVTAAGRD